MSLSGIDTLFAGLLALSALIWVFLTFFRGDFWRFAPKLEDIAAYRGGKPPQVIAIVPARNEAAVIARSLSSVRGQSYSGLSAVVLADDSSEDETLRIAGESKGRAPLLAVSRPPPPAGWSGKLWALHGGVERAAAEFPASKYYWFTDADILHQPDVLARLVARAEKGNLGLVSTMVRLNVATFAEKLLIPPFVFFFSMLYPFKWVNGRDHRTAAAAGGSLLISADALKKIGGIASFHSALIDDCTLAGLVKRAGFPIWLGHGGLSHSIRAYRFADIWRMVKRSAFAQLRYSRFLLLLTVLGMAVTFLLSPIAVILALIDYSAAIGSAGGLTWFWMAAIMAPTIRAYGLTAIWGLLLPAVAALYLVMTLDSAWAALSGAGSSWKGRSYGGK